MPKSGLSLVGFMDLPWAVEHFRKACVLADTSDRALTAEWNAARAKLGPPLENAGRPEIAALPASAEAHVRTATSNPYHADWLERIRPLEFRLVEIGPLLAHQPVVETAGPSDHGRALGPDASMGDLLKVCIPLGDPQAELRLPRSENSFLISSRFQLVVGGYQGPGNKVGVEFARPMPFFQVTEHAGRCYLINGFHRALTLGRAGITHVPCLFRRVDDWEKMHIRQGNISISKQVLESANPPTVSHFTRGLAYPVTLRDLRRFVHVSWVEFTVEDD
jgi:hypothetical protein